MSATYEWLKHEHPIYESQKELWERNERRYYGGDAVLTELRPFEWEDATGLVPLASDHYRARVLQATYINFVDLFARTIVGHVMRNAPEQDMGLSFGQLGEVRRDADDAKPTQAEMVFYNADGVGNDGSQWENFWSTAVQLAMCTGHRWIYVEATEEAPETKADEEQGKRPYLMEISPLAVLNWHVVEGKLAFAVLKVSERNPHLDKSNAMAGNEYEDGYLLLVKEGFTGFGDDFAGGGWWRFGADLELLTKIDDAGEPRIVSGDWEKTDGEIPLFPLFYERAKGTKEVQSMSRPGVTEIGQAAVSYMNLSSAADYDVWDAAQSVQYVLGVDQKSYNLATEKLKAGSKLIPFPADGRTGNVPAVHDGSLGAVTATVFETRLQRKLDEVNQLAALEASGAPDSSGESKRVGFADVKAPRLALIASELEQAQNTAIHFLEMRFGHGNPTGVVSWPREFDLAPVIDSIREVFELQQLTELRSRTLEIKAMLAAAKAKGLIVDDEEEALIEAELRRSAVELDQAGQLEQNAQAQETDALVRQATQAAGVPGATTTDDLGALTAI